MGCEVVVESPVSKNVDILLATLYEKNCYHPSKIVAAPGKVVFTDAIHYWALEFVVLVSTF